MRIRYWLDELNLKMSPGQNRRRRTDRCAPNLIARPLKLEALEDRCLLSFNPISSFDVGASPQAVATGHFDSDDQLDLVTVNSADNTVSVFLGNGDGTFQPEMTSEVGSYPVSIAVGDFDEDGNLDLATANGGDNTVSILLGKGDGTFEAPTNLELADYETIPTSVSVGDFNGDGTLDLGVVSNYPFSYYYYYGYYGYYGQATVLMGVGDGSFEDPINNWLNYGYHTSGVVADFNDDGFDDMAVTNSWYSEVRVLPGNGSGALSWNAGWWGTTDYYSTSVAADDVNGDGTLDVITASYYENSISVFLGNEEKNGFIDSSGASFATGSYPTSVILGDFTGDGNLDIVTANSLDNNISLLRGDGEGGFSIPESFATESGTWAVASGDFDGDGWLDAVAVNLTDSSATVFMNDQSWPILPPTASISDATVTEGNSGTVNATFTVTLSKVSDDDVTVHYQTSDISATAGDDYTAKSGDLIIPAGAISGTFSVAVKGDRIGESNETFAVNLSDPTNTIIVDGQGIGTILDDEPRISINDVSKQEGNAKKTTLFTFTVTLSADYDQPVTVDYTTANGSATASSDYLAKTGTVTFAAGVTSQTITISVMGDKLKEPNETYFVNLTGSNSGLITDNQGVGTILNDERSSGKGKPSKFASAVDAAIADWMNSQSHDRGLFSLDSDDWLTNPLKKRNR